MKQVMLGLIALSLAGSAQAQNVVYWPAPAQSAGTGQKYYLPMGTPIMLRTLTHISSKDNRPGERIYLEVAENVMFQNQVVIPADAPASAEVSFVQRNGHLGQKGKVEIRLIAVQTPGGAVPLTGNATGVGKSGRLLSVGTIMFVSTLGGFLIHGTSGRIDPGTPIQAQLAGDLAFRARPGEMSAAAAPVSNFHF